MLKRNPRLKKEAEGIRIRGIRSAQFSWDAGSAAWWELENIKAYHITAVSPGAGTASG